MRKSLPVLSAARRFNTARITAAAFLLLIAAPLVRAQQQDLTGYWDLQVPRTDGSVRETYFQLQQNGATLTGTLFGRANGGAPLTGTLTGDQVHLAIAPPPNAPNARPFSFDGTFRDGVFTLTAPARNQPTTGTAVRTTREKADPAPLPLPAPRDLPDNGLVRTPPMGWNSWNKFANRITDADVRGMADAMVASGMAKLGYTYINIDDTWEGGRDAEGNIVPNNKFPDMKALADYVHSKGLKIGIYSSPGRTTCEGYEASFGHEVQDAKTFAAWGIDYLKYDLCSAGAIYPYTPENIRGLYQKMGEALQASGRPIVFSLCEYGLVDPWLWGAKAGGNLWRTTGDISDHWASMDKIGFSQLAISSYTRPGHWNDPDMLEIGNGGMTADEYRTHMSLWSMLAAPLIAGNDLRAMSEETKSILMNPEVIAIDQDPAAKPVQELTSVGKVEILTRPMQDGTLIVGLFNRGSEPAPASFAWTTLPAGFDHRPAMVRNLWTHQPVQSNEDVYSATVPTHGVVQLRVTPNR
jgi:alpha-galactosidase